jgi:hypothetical protein
MQFRWSVGVSGDERALNFLCQVLEDSDTSIFLDRGSYRIRSARFEDFTDASEVHNAAEALLQELSGLVNLVTNGVGVLLAGGVVDANPPEGQPHYTLVAHAGSFLIRGSPAVLRVNRADGCVEVDEHTRFVRACADASSRDARAAKVLRLLGQPALDWVGMYRILEVVEDAVGRPTIQSWVGKKRLGLFRHTADSVSAIGDEARHGKERTDPPARPMSKHEARRLTLHVVELWLRSIGDGGTLAALGGVRTDRHGYHAALALFFAVGMVAMMVTDTTVLQ